MSYIESGTGPFQGEVAPPITFNAAFNGLNENALADIATEALAVAEDFAAGRNLSAEMELERNFPALAKMRGDHKDEVKRLATEGQLLPSMARDMTIGFDSVVIALSRCGELRGPLQQLTYNSLADCIRAGASITSDQVRCIEAISHLKDDSKPLWRLRSRLGTDVFQKAVVKARQDDPGFSGGTTELPDMYQGSANMVRFGNHTAIFAIHEYLQTTASATELQT